MEFSVIKLPSVCLLVFVRGEDTDLICFRYGNRRTLCDYDPVNILRLSISLKAACFLSACRAVVEYVLRFHTSRRYANDRNFIIRPYFCRYRTGCKVARIDELLNALRIVKNRSYLTVHDNNKRFVIAYNILYCRNVIVELCQNIISRRRKRCLFLARTLSQRRNTAITICVYFGNDL